MKLEYLKELSNTKNLLAYSGGTDSNTLAHALYKKNINFDIAIVNYHTRETSNKEVDLAKELAKKLNCRIFIHDVYDLNSKTPSFEEAARKERHSFFEKIIQKHNYVNLVTGHNMTDRLEWMLMQFTKGCGFNELISLEGISKRTNFNIYRPLISISKQEIMDYLFQNNLEYFEDETNQDTKYKRNYFRHKYALKLTEAFSEGIKKSFSIMDDEKEDLSMVFEEFHPEKNFFIARDVDLKTFVKKADKLIKQVGYILSYQQRKELEHNLVINFYLENQEYIVSYDQKNQKLWLTPFMRETLSKKTREELRKKEIPIKSRTFIAKLNGLS